MSSIKVIRAALCASVLSVSLATATNAQPPVVIGGGLVNVQIGAIDVTTGDILSDNTIQLTVQAAANVAANVCGTAVNVLATQIAAGQQIRCTADAQSGEQDVVQFVYVN